MGRGTQAGAATIPTLVTERCVLRAFREDDVPAIAELHGDPEVMRYLSCTGEPEPNFRDAWDHIALHLGQWVLKGHGKWALADGKTDRLIGRVGFYDPPHDWPGLELGWTVARNLWGQGYASEAARAALRWGFENIEADEIISIIHQDNARSIRVAERLGETPRRADVVRGEPCLIYGISRDEWERNNIGA